MKEWTQRKAARPVFRTKSELGRKMKCVCRAAARGRDRRGREYLQRSRSSTLVRCIRQGCSFLVVLMFRQEMKSTNAIRNINGERSSIVSSTMLPCNRKIYIPSFFLSSNVSFVAYSEKNKLSNYARAVSRWMCQIDKAVVKQWDMLVC